MHARNFISVAALCAAGVLNARTITVDANGGADFSSIDAAMEAAAPGDVVSVAPGVYREEVRARRSGTEKNPIVVESAVRGAAVVRGSEVWKNAWTRRALFAHRPFAVCRRPRQSLLPHNFPGKP